MPDPNKIEGGRWDTAIRKLFNLKGAGSTSARISDDISPTFNFPFRAEDDFLLNEKLFWAPARSGLTVGQNPRCILTNVSNNALLIIEKVVFQVAGGGIPYFGILSGTVPFIAAIPIFARDGRINALGADVGSGNARMQEGTLVGAPIPIVVRFLTTDSLQQIDNFNLVLEPGDSFFFTNGTTNTLTQWTLWWREHLMEPGEFA